MTAQQTSYGFGKILVSFVLLFIAALALLFSIYFDNPLDLFREVLSVLRSLDRSSPWFTVIGYAFLVISGLICFPVNVAIAVVALLFKPTVAVPLILLGCTTSAVLGYYLGIVLDPYKVPFISKSTIRSACKFVENNGVKSSLMLRFMPVAPFTIVNFTLGMVRTPLRHFILGCIIGLLPGTLFFTVFGYSLSHLTTDPTFQGVGIGVGVILAAVILVKVLRGSRHTVQRVAE